MNSQQNETPVRRIGIVPYNVGLCFASVCAPRDASIEEIEAEVDRQHPTGLDHGWRLSREAYFQGGQSNPCTCNDDPTRTHWLLDC